LHSVLAIIVTFNPNLRDLKLLLEWSKYEPVGLVVVDNGSRNLTEISVLMRWHPEALFISLGDNLGLAYAQNIGLKHALGEGFEFALLLDQDSLPDSGFVRKAVQAFSALDPLGVNVAGVAPRFFDSRTGYSFPFIRFKRCSVVVFEPCQRLEYVSLLISSGSMLRTSMLRNIGLMNEAFFIDHIDTEWCLRATAKGFRLVGVADNRMRHSVGDSTIRVAGRYLPEHNPGRRYLATRNLYYLIFHARAPIAWKLKELITSILKLALILPKSSDPFKHIKYFFMGALDGLTSDFSRGQKNDQY
jgi:rhamnosyltransferase